MMAAPELTVVMKENGDTLLASLRGDGVEVLAAFWSLGPVVDEWRLVVVSPQVETRGPKKILRFTHKILQEMDTSASFTFFDVDYRSPNNSQFLALAQHLKHISLGPYSSIGKMQVGDVVIQNMFFYVFDSAAIMAANEFPPRLAAE